MGLTNKPLMYHSPRVRLKEANRFKGRLTTAKICTTLAEFYFFISMNDLAIPQQPIIPLQVHCSVPLHEPSKSRCSCSRSRGNQLRRISQVPPTFTFQWETFASPRLCRKHSLPHLHHGGNLQHILGHLWKSQEGEPFRVQSTMAG